MKLAFLGAIWFISVWCFLAALMSVVVYLHFLPAPLQQKEVRQ